MKTVTLYQNRQKKWTSVIAFFITMWILCMPFRGFSQEINVYSEGFEANNGGYTKIIEPADPQFPTLTGDGLWMWGTPSWVAAHTGSKCWGTNFSGNMPRSTSSILSPVISLAELTTNQSTRVSFWAAVDISMTGASGRFYVSSDGSNFTKLASFFINMAGGWQRYEFDVSNYNGGDIYLKFYIIDNGSKRGFYVDDISISAFTKPAVTKILTLEANESSNGSCPWIYTWDGSDYRANNDIYSTARYQGGEYRDYLALAKPLVPENGMYKLQVNEVASDESFTDYVQLNMVDHATDVKVAPDNFGNIFAYKPANLFPPVSAISNLGVNVLDSLSQDDGNGFNAYSQDYVDVDFGNVDISAGARMVLKMQGFLDGTGIPRPFTGPPAVVVKSLIDGVWTEVGRMHPRFEWDVCAFDVSTFSINPATGVKVRLFSISHGLKYSNIDYVALETGTEPAKTVTIAPFSSATFSGNSVFNQLNTADNQYANLLPGNHMNLEFIAPPLTAPVRSFIFTSEGYYIPRGSTYFIATWSGTAWIIHDGYSFANTDETKTFDLSLFLPDPANEMKVRIWQDYAEGASYPASIDFVGIQQGVTVGTLSTATELTGNTSIIPQVVASDNVYWALHNQVYDRTRWIECKWTGIINNGVPVVSGLNVVSGSTMSWVYTDPENDPQTEASVQVWTGSGGTGTLYWGPDTFTGTGTSVTYAGTPMVYGVTYYLRVKATDGNNWCQWVEYSFLYNIQSPPGIYTTTATSITSTSAASGGKIFNNGGSAVTERGVCWSTSANPTIADSHSHDGTGSGIFTSSLTPLSGALGVTYYYRAYGTNTVGTGYGPQLSFTYSAPTVTTTAITNIAPTTATSGGYVVSNGNSAVTDRGVCWNTSGTPTIADSKTTDGTGTGGYTSSITGLTLGITYFVRAYATNEFGTSYGAERSFTASINFCTPPASSTTCIMWITNVTTTGGTTNFNNTSGCAPTSFTDFSSTISASQAAGSSVTMSFTSYQYAMGYSVWIDFNDNGIFASDEKVISLYTGGMTVSTSFTVPSNAPGGSHKMRVRGDYQSAPADPCAALQYGETEDYAFVVSNSAPADPTSITATANPVCSGSSTQLTANGPDGTVYWYTGSCGTTGYFDSGNSITVSPTSTTTYYARNYNNGQYSAGCASIVITVEQPAVSGSLTKSPNVAAVCEGTNVSATLTAGSGGNGTDETEYRTFAGSWSAWAPYVSGTNISTTGKTAVEIQTRRLAAYCSASSYTTVSWSVEVTPVSGTLAKTPNVTTVCQETNVSAVLTAGSGGNGTDILEYRTKSGIVWSEWAIYVSGNTILTSGLSGVEVHTFRVADYCDDAATVTVDWVVDPTTAGGAVTGGELVCYGSNSTLLTLSGHIGSVLWWEWSANGVDWNVIANTADTYTATNLIVDTWFRAVVQSGVCLVGNSEATEITVFSDYHISGYAKYNNNPKTPLNGLKITLKQDGIPIGTPVVTGLTGFYEFTGLINGTYDLEIASAHASGLWQTWSGVNNTDYLLVARHAAGVSLLPVDPPVVRVTASVKLPHPAINSVDVTAIQYAAKYGWGYFDIQKWAFSGLNSTSALTGIQLNCANEVREIRGLCAGDVNGSLVPPYGIKQATPGVELVNRGLLPVTQEIIFPVRAEQDMEIGAITLLLDFDASQLEITGVEMPGRNETPYFFVTRDASRVTEGLLNIGWMSLNPLTVAGGETLLLIHARISNIEQRISNIERQIRFTLNDNPMSELADAEGNVIDGAKLTIADAGHPSPVTRHNEMLSVYPNPVSETLSIEYLMETEGVFNAELMNPQGVVVVRTGNVNSQSGMNKTTLNLRELPNGAYLLKAVCGESRKTVKVIVNR